MVLYVGTSPDKLRQYFREVRRVGAVTEDMSVWLLSGRLESWDTMWPRLRTLSVS